MLLVHFGASFDEIKWTKNILLFLISTVVALVYPSALISSYTFWILLDI